MSTIIETRLGTSLHAMAVAGGVLMAWFVLAAGAVFVRTQSAEPSFVRRLYGHGAFFYDHEDVVRHQAMPRGDFHREAVRRCEHLPVQ